MTDHNHLSRYQRRHKRRNTNIQIFLFGGLAGIIFIILLVSLSSGGKTDDKTANGENTEPTETMAPAEENETHDSSKNDHAKDEDKVAKDKEEKDKNDENQQANKSEYIDRKTYAKDITLQPLTTTDQNVDEAYIADWPPIGTKQSGKHTVSYEDGSDDRLEIKKAISYVTELEEEDIIEHWIGNGGDQKVIATVSDKEMEKHYKVYLSWVKDEGWKPTKLEELKAVNKNEENNEG